MSEQDSESKPTGATSTTEPEAKAPEGLSVKDKLSLTISIIALVLSLATAFWTTARVSENVSVVVRGPQLLHRGEKGGAQVFVVGDPSDLVFINSGNRPAVILDVQIGFLTTEGKKSCAEMKGGTRFTTSFKTLVVKEGEIGTTSVKIDSVESINYPAPKGKTPLSKNWFYLDASVVKKNPLDAVSCLLVELSTPSIAYQKIGVPISNFQMVDASVSFNPTEDEGRNVPQQLYSRFGTIFTRPNEMANKANSQKSGAN